METSATNKSFDINAKPSEEMLAKAGLVDLPEKDPDRGGRDHISGPVVTEHTAYTLSESGHDFELARSRTFILRPSVDSRESLSLAIFETTPTSIRPVSGLPTMPALPHAIPEEELLDAVPPVPSLPGVAKSSASSSSSTRESRRPPLSSMNRKSSRSLARSSSHSNSPSNTDRSGMATEPERRQRPSRSSSSYTKLPNQSERSVRSHSSPPGQTRSSQSSLMTASTDYMPRQSSASNIDFTQQPHPHYSYYRGESSRRTSAAPSMHSNNGGNSSDSNAPPMPVIPNAYKGSVPDEQFEMTEQPNTTRSKNETSLEPRDRESVYSKRESISALPPVPKSRNSVRTVKSTMSVRSTKPKKLQRKNTTKSMSDAADIR
jgi:hypothetical protein